MSRLSIIVPLLFAACGRPSDGVPEVEHAAGRGDARPMGGTAQPSDHSAPALYHPAPDVAAPYTPEPMGGAFSEEARARTHARPEAEDVLRAFAAGRLPLATIKQGLGRTSGAQYCVLGDSPRGQRVVVCEYADEARATAALPGVRAELVDERRRVEARGRLAMTVLSGTTGAEDLAERDALFALFVQATP